MNYRISRVTGRLLLAACCLLGLTALSFAQAPAGGKPSLLFVTEWCGGEQEDVPLLAELRAAGFQVDDLGFQHLTLEKMRRYNAVIFPEFPMTDPMTTVNHTWLVKPELLNRVLPEVDAYVKEGGGVVVYGVCFFQTHENGMENMNRMMAPWGAETLFEQVLDNERNFTYKQLYSCTYSWTTNLAKHPLTEGLNRIFYVTDNQHGPRTCTFKLSPDWQALARGEASARSVPANHTNYSQTPWLFDKKGMYDSAPPIIAVRPYGKGRLALIGITPVVAVFGARFIGYGNVLLDAGDGTLTSDYGQLQQRLYRWASEPALATGAPGGYVDAPKPYRINADTALPFPNWPAFAPGRPGHPPLRGLIGARTAAGGGSGTVADYVAAAEKAGLDFIAFTDDFAKLDQPKWESFKKTCAEASTPKVTAIPGVLYRDSVGARMIALGEFTYPRKEYRGADGTRIIDPNWLLSDGQWCMIAPIDVGHNPRPYWTYALYTAMAVKTYERGTLLDDATAAFLDREEVEDILSPIIVDLLASPADVAGSATHTTNVLVANGQALRTAISRNTNGGERFSASTGPRISDWRCINSVRTPQGQWDPIPGSERLAAIIGAQSPVGIKTIRLLDGPHTLRRFDAAGAKEFSRVVHLLHDRQRHLLVEVTDTAGNTAISGQYTTADQLNVRRMCGDRGNTIDFAVVRSDTGRVFITGPVAPYQRKTTLFGFFPGYTDLSNKYAAPYVDGGLRPVGYQAEPQVRFKGEKPREGTFASKMVNPLASRDVILQQSDLIGWYDNPRTHAWAPAELVGELKDYTASVRWVDFVKRYHDPGLTLVEGTITFLRDGVLDTTQGGNPSLVRMFNQSTDAYCPGFSIQGIPGGGLAGQTSKTNPSRYDGPLNQGGFVSVLPNLWGSGAVMTLDPGYTTTAIMTRPTAFTFVGLPMDGQAVKKGQQVKYRLLVGRGVVGTDPSDKEWRDFCAAMGLTGKPAYSIDVTQGKLLATAYLLEGDAADGGFAAKIGKASLPVRLPIRVNNVNPRCTAAIVNCADGSFLPVGVIETERIAYATWDPSKVAAEIYVGNLVTTPSPDLIVTAVATGKQWTVEIHNPTDKPVTSAVKGAAKFVPLAGFAWQGRVPSGQSITVPFPARP
ncbi:MAG: hypothetical protein ACYC7E_07070 [Armatimonadota bacterium]